MLTEAGLLVGPGRCGGRALDEEGVESAHGASVAGGGAGSGKRTKRDWDSDQTLGPIAVMGEC